MNHNQPFPTMQQQPTCTVQVDGQPFDVKMTFGLLNQVTRHVGDANNIPLIMLNPDLREAILQELLAERGPGGKITKMREVDSVEISMDDCEKLLEFASDHVTDFLIRALEKTNARTQKNLDKYEALKRTSDGLKASVLTKPAA